MSNHRSSVLALRTITLASIAALASVSQSLATTYTDTVGDQAGGSTYVDIASVNVTNDASNLTIVVNLASDISQSGTTDWGNYHIGFDTAAGGSTAVSVPWGQTFGMSQGMDFWIGSWVNFGGGSDVQQYTGGAWTDLGALATVGLGTTSVTYTVPLATLGLSAGNTFKFDVWSTFGVPGGQGAYDALSNPALTVADPWNGTAYDSSTAGAGATPLLSSYTVASVVSGSTWNVDADGNWSAPGNWSGGVPSGAGASASFGTIITAARTVTIDSAATVGQLNFSSPIGYTLTGSATLTLDGGTGSTSISVTAGSHVINAPIVLARDTAVALSGGGALSVQHVRGAGLSIAGGTMKILHNATANSASGTSKVTSLIIGTGASLDLTNNSLVIDYTGAVGTLVADTRVNLQSGNLTSSSADATHKLGYGDNATLGKSTFAGQTVDASSLLVKFTYGGDANLDGQVDVTDLGALATNWQTSSVWTGGDFNYDGFVDVTDLGILATNWQAGVGSPLGPGSFDAALASVGLGGVTVPEPATIGMLGFCLAAAISRRRTRSKKR